MVIDDDKINKYIVHHHEVSDSFVCATHHEVIGRSTTSWLPLCGPCGQEQTYLLNKTALQCGMKIIFGDKVMLFLCRQCIVRPLHPSDKNNPESLKADPESPFLNRLFGDLGGAARPCHMSMNRLNNLRFNQTCTSNNQSHSSK